MAGENPTIQQVQVVDPPPKPSIEERLHAHRMRELEAAGQPAPAQPAAAPERARAPDGKFAPPAEPTPEGGTEPTPEVQGADAAGAEDDAEAVEIATLNDLAEHMGVDVADLYNVRVKVTTADGQPAEVSLGEWKDGWQGNEKLTRAQQQLERERAEWAAKAQAEEQAYAKRQQEATAILQAVQQEFLAEYNAVDWNGLRYSNPGEFAARQAEMQAKAQRLQGIAQHVQTQQAQMEQQRTEEYQRQVAAHTERERRALESAVPEFKDPVKADAETQRIREYLTGLGYTADDLNKVVDHRLVILARNAMLYEKMSKKAVEAKKAVVRIGKKVLTPSARTSAGGQRTDAIAAAQAQLRKTGNWQDAASLLALRRKR